MDVNLTDSLTAIDYPTSDGRPMAETDLHRVQMTDVIQTLDDWFSPVQDVYVSGNLLVYYVRGNRHMHVSPDVFVVRGIPKRIRDYYLVWDEGKGPDFVIELTSKSTKDEDLDDKFDLYQKELKVREYILFDPRAEYLDPPFQGHRLADGQYEPITPVAGRIPSEVLGLHLERRGQQLRLFDPATGLILPTRAERVAQAEALAQREMTARQRAEAELERLRQELAALRGQSGS